MLKDPRSTRNIRLTSIVATVIAAGMVMAGCTSNSTAHSGADSGGGTGGTIVWAKSKELSASDPAPNGIAADGEFFHEIYGRLVDLDDNGRVVPSLATSWSRESPTSYLFTLRSGAKFSNGRLLTVDDVVGSLNRVMDPKTASSWAAKLGIATVSAVGANQVRIVLAAPRSAFVSALAGPAASILPMKELTAGTFDPKKTLLGTGPYEVKTHLPGQTWTLVRNPYYWGPAAKAAKVLIKIMPDEAARIAALRDGSADVTSFDSPDAVGLLKGSPNITTAVLPTTAYYRLDVNAMNSIFADQRLRQALALSVDRKKIVKLALAGLGAPSAAVAPTLNACDASHVPNANPDPAKAKSLVDAAGAAGKTVTIFVDSDISTLAPIAQVLQQDLTGIGLNPKIVQLDIGGLLTKVYGKQPEFDLNISFYSNFNDATLVLPNYKPKVARFNAAYELDDPNLDTVIDQAMSQPTGAERNRTLQNACDMIAADANVIPLVTRSGILAYRADRVAAHPLAVDAFFEPLANIASFGTR